MCLIRKSRAFGPNAPNKSSVTVELLTEIMTLEIISMNINYMYSDQHIMVQYEAIFDRLVQFIYFFVN